MSEDEENFVKRLSISPNSRSLQDISSIREYLKYIEGLRGYKDFTISEFARIARYEKYEVNHRLFKIGDKCTSWYILLSGCVLLGQTMFFPRKSFGHRSQGTICRYDDCVILEKTELIVIDYNLDRHTQVGSMGSKQDDSPNLMLENSCHGFVSERSSHASDTSSAISGCDIANLSYENVSENDYHDPDTDSLSQDINSINDFFYDIIVKEPSKRSESDNETILDGVHNLSAFTNFTAKTKLELCRAMRSILVNNANEQILADGFLIETWNVILDGIIEVRYKDGSVREYSRGDSFGVKPIKEEQFQDGDLWTITPSCLFLCVNQKDFCEIISRNSDGIIPETEDNGRVVLVYEERIMSSNFGNTGRIIVKGRIEKLLNNLLEDQSKSDPMYMENFLLTYRIFMKSPKVLAAKLCQWYEAEPVGVVTKIKNTIRKCILLWASYHFEDLDNPRADMNEYFEKFDKLLSDEAYSEQDRRLFFKICSTNSKERFLTVNIQKDEVKKLPFRLIGLQNGLGLFIKEVYSKTSKLRCGDQILLLENYSWEDWESLEKVSKKIKSISKGSIEMIVKYNPSEFHSILNELSVTKSEKKYESSDTGSLAKISNILFSSRPQIITQRFRRSVSVNPLVTNRRSPNNLFITPMSLPKPDESMPFSTRVKLETNSRSANTSPSRRLTRSKSRGFQCERSAGSGLSSNLNKKLERCSSPSISTDKKSYRPEVLKVFKPNSSDSKLVLMTNNTSAKEAVVLIMKEFSIDPSEVVKYGLYLVTVDVGPVTKSSRISPYMKDLAATLALNQRYYLKKIRSDSQLITDEQAKVLLKESKVTLSQLTAFEIATRLTFIDYALFREIKAAEYINHHLNLSSLEEIDSLNISNIESSESDQSKNNTEGFSTGCENYKKFQDLINMESFWPTTEICLEPNVSKRADLIKKFIEVAKICKDLKNFNSLFCIIMGLDLTPVQRLKASWDKVPNKFIKTFEKLKCLTDFSFNFRQIRQLVLPEINEPPIIPYLAIHHKDLATIHMGNKTCSKDGLINFEKLRMMASEIRKLTTMCSTSYNLQNIISSSASRHTSNESDATSGISICSNNSTVKKKRSNSVDQCTYNATLKKKFSKRQSLSICESPIKTPRKIYEEWLSTLKVRTYLLNLNVNENPDHLQELSNRIEPPSNKSVSSSTNILLAEPQNYNQTGYSKASSNKSSISISISQSSPSPSPSPAELLSPSNFNKPPNSEKHSDIGKPQELNGRPMSIFSFQNQEINVTLRELMHFKGKVSRSRQILSRNENGSREQSFNLGMDQNYLRNLPMYNNNRQLMRELSMATVTHQENNDDLFLEGVSSYVQPSISNSLFEKKISKRAYRYPMAGGHLNNYYYGECFGDQKSCMKPDLPSYETAKAISQNQKLNTNLQSTDLNNKSTIAMPQLSPKPVYPPPYNKCVTQTTNVPPLLSPKPVNSSKTCKSSEPSSNFNNIN